MADVPNPSREPSFSRLFPWVRLLSACTVATDAKKVLLAATGLLLTNACWDFLDGAFPASRAIAPEVREPMTWGQGTPFPGFPSLETASQRVAEPARAVLHAFAPVFRVDVDASTFAHALLAAAWAAAVWGIFGGAISRIATVQVATHERIGGLNALRFARGKALVLIGGPMTPLLAVVGFAAFLALYGLLYRLPGAIAVRFAGLFLVLPLLGGFLMALILGGLAASWPLIIASVAAESQDGFDALSRAYAYFRQRAIPYAAYIALAWLLGTFGYLFIDLFGHLVVHLAEWGLSVTVPRERLLSLFRSPATPFDTTEAHLHAFWLSAVGFLIRSWVYSYFWTAASIIYLLLRREVDGTEWNTVALPPPAPSPWHKTQAGEATRRGGEKGAIESFPLE